MKSESGLERLLEAGHFVVTAECGPPKGADPESIRKKVGFFKGYVDAVNVTDNQTAIVRMSSVASCMLLLQAGMEPIMQMVTRDRNRIAIQSDILGAYALGIRNLLCLTGDHQTFGSHPECKGVFDLDSVQLVYTVRLMRDEGRLLNGDHLEGNPRLFIGATENPFAAPLEYRVIRLAKKVRAGADFIQTQCIYNLERFEQWMGMVRARGLHRQTYILAGVTPLKSLGMARYMREKVAGMDIPEPIIEWLKGVPPSQREAEGINICVETIQRLKEIEGVRGIHLMAIGWEEVIPEIVERAGLLPRPTAG